MKSNHQPHLVEYLVNFLISQISQIKKTINNHKLFKGT